MSKVASVIALSVNYPSTLWFSLGQSGVGAVVHLGNHLATFLKRFDLTWGFNMAVGCYSLLSHLAFESMTTHQPRSNSSFASSHRGASRATKVAAMCLTLGLGLAACSPEDPAADSTSAISMKTDSRAHSSATVTETETRTHSSTATSTITEASPSSVAMDSEDAPDGAFSTSSAEAAPARDSYLGIEDVRIGSHRTHDRIVFEFTGEGTPGYFIRYEELPLQQGSGHPISVKGDAKLSIDLRGMGYPFDFGVDDYPRGPVRPTNTKGINEVVGAGTFEGYTQYAVGMRGKQVPFRVFTLNNPTRLVIDFDTE